ncbi:hypothetical protein M7775_13780 [Sporomusa sphaeroides DSM 2875]|uniref:hypothetical protein n=1 Tax=Sporomusa sphaeroides TaxID=47679 RepID=UPI00202FDC51|nr:hypothetical protein [Sporomusa sphaeroides]MCM0759624.1 hypothetical protein [Sporomusa sphaeroides DSM 2875]
MTSLTKRQAAILLGVVLLVAVAGWLLWQHYNQPEPVTPLSQQQAETPAGVEHAADNAQVKLMQEQLNEAAKEIARLKNKPPDKVVVTEVKVVEKVVEKEVEKRGANFGIVTDPANPEKPVDLGEIAKLPEGTIVNLNQYNVFAYKKIIRGVNVFPALDGGRVKINEVTVDVSRRITKDGKYIGVVAGYDFEYNKAKAGIRYSF